MNGAWGVIAAGLFATPTRMEDAYGRSDHVGFFYSFSHGGADATLLAAQLVGLLFICGWVMFTMLPFFYALAVKGWFRADALDEIVGLDRSYHGGIVLGGDDSVRPEDIAEYRKRKLGLLGIEVTKSTQDEKSDKDSSEKPDLNEAAG